MSTLPAAMLQELDQTAAELNISRQAVIKAFLRQALDQHHVARKARKSKLGLEVATLRATARITLTGRSITMRITGKGQVTIPQRRDS